MTDRQHTDCIYEQVRNLDGVKLSVNALNKVEEQISKARWEDRVKISRLEFELSEMKRNGHPGHGEDMGR